MAGANIRASLQLQLQHKSKYLSLTAALGARALVQHGLAVHYAEADFTPEEVELFPELRLGSANRQRRSACHRLSSSSAKG